jgi:hypothetical protein
MARTLLVSMAALAAILVPGGPGGTSVLEAPNLEAYRGLGAWVDLFEDRAWRRPAKAVADMKAHGVRTLYLETSNYTQRRAIAFPREVGRFLEAAHARDMDVVAWYLPGFKDLNRDLRRSMMAIRFRTDSGERFDSFGLDIEASIVDSPSKRSRRLLTLSRQIRSRAGARYPLGAIIPSPRGIELAEGYWPGFPYVQLAQIYDVFVPMGYFTYHVSGSAGSHFDTVRNIEILRQEVGDPTVPVHLIGGIADDASGLEVRAFVHAVREHGLLGASLYNWSLTRDHDWTELEQVPTNPRQAPALPVPLGYTEPLGNVPGGVQGHPKEVFFVGGGLPGPRAVEYEAFDLQAGEVALWVNWRLVAELEATAPDSWGEPQTIPMPDEVLNDAGRNVVAFTADGDHPDWSAWGIRAVRVL